MSKTALVAGARIDTRGENFLITDINENYDGSFLIDAEGISELVKGKSFKFDTNIDNDINKEMVTLFAAKNGVGVAVNF